jgi:hypothetical protein
MPEYLRVIDPDTGHESTVAAPAAAHGFVVLDEPAVDPITGDPLPPKFAAPKSLPSKSTPTGQKASQKKESTDD